jgi:hypothetical protein
LTVRPPVPDGDVSNRSDRCHTILESRSVAETLDASAPRQGSALMTMSSCELTQSRLGWGMKE